MKGIKELQEYMQKARLEFLDEKENGRQRPHISSKANHAIGIISDHKKSVITILNYEKYNPLAIDKKTTKFEPKKTTERPQTGPN